MAITPYIRAQYPTIEGNDRVYFDNEFRKIQETLGQVLRQWTPGKTLLETGSLSSTAVDIISIPDDYAYLYLRVTNASTNGTDELLVRADSNNGASFDSTASNYQNHFVTGTTWAQGANASLCSTTTVTSAQSTYVNLYIFGYQNTIPVTRYSNVCNSVIYQGMGFYQGGVPIDSLRILGSAGGTFDAGTYALYGIR